MTRFRTGMTTWHITFGTYGTRLHGGERPSIDQKHNEPGEDIIERDPDLEDRNRNQMRAAPVHLSIAQRRFIQEEVPRLCERGGWMFRMCSAGDDHVHVLLDIDRSIHGEKVRRLLKRWLTQALDERWHRPASGRWWAEEGSNIAIHDEHHFANANDYIAKQRTK